MSLTAKLARQIALSGPLTIAEFMERALTDKEDGYYLSQTPFGRSGDFITAPEISQIFGELIGIWVILSWQALGEPAHFTLAEGGPGRGILADDILRVLQKLCPACFRAAQLCLLEISPALRRVQQEKLKCYQKPICWAETAAAFGDTAEAAEKPLIFIANELLDALPVHQYQKTAAGWREKRIAADKTGALHFTLDLPQTVPAFCREADFAALLARAPLSAIAETAPVRTAFIRVLSRRIKKTGGAALLIDYGAAEHGLGDTVQAVAKHKFVPLLDNIGKSDISSHVNFAALAAQARAESCRAALLTQGEFLLKLGLETRIARLSAGKNAAEQSQIRAAGERLAAPNAMGELFKALCITDSGTEMPPFAW